MLREPPAFRRLPLSAKARIRSMGGPNGRRQALGASAFRSWLGTPGGVLAGTFSAPLGMLLGGWIFGELAFGVAMAAAGAIVAGAHRAWLTRRLDRDLDELRRHHPEWFVEEEAATGTSTGG